MKYLKLNEPALRMVKSDPFCFPLANRNDSSIFSLIGIIRSMTLEV